MTLRRKILLIAAGLLAVAIVAGALAWRQLSTGSGAVSAGSAENTYKLAAGGSMAGPPRPGVYTYALRGSECARIAGFPLCRTFPSPARMILTRKPGTITLELDLSQDHLELNRYAVHPDGRYLSWERTRVVFGIAQDDAEATVPATLAVPATLRVGLHWTQRFSAGGLPVVTSDRVTRQATLVVGGAQVTAYEIDASSKIGGVHSGTEDDVTWHAPGSGLDLRLIIHRRIGGVFPYTMDMDATLLSLKPLA